MTTQLRDNRAQIDQFTRNLQQAVQELERRRQLMETILENIPTGVIYLWTPRAASAREYGASRDMFGEAARKGYRIARGISDRKPRHRPAPHAPLIAHGSRYARNRSTVVGGRVLHVAVTVSSLGPRRANTGFVARARRPDRNAARPENRGVAGSGAARSLTKSRIRSRPFSCRRSASAPPGACSAHDACAGAIPNFHASLRNAPA